MPSEKLVVIPAPLASEARERDQAGTQTPRGLLLGARTG
jgi:hypothetical protein